MQESNQDLEKKRDQRIGEYFLVQEQLEGHIVANEKPDLDYHVEDEVIGIELTELVPANSKTRLPGVDRVLNRCRELHELKRYPNVRCFVNFDTNYRIKKIDADKIAEALMRALASSLQQYPKIGEEIRIDNDLPNGVINVSIHAPIVDDGPALYSSHYVVGHEILQNNHITDCVHGKEALLKNYRSGLHQYWLIMHFGHLPGETWYIGPTPDLLAEFPIESSFDRVYLLTPQIDGGVWRFR